MDLKEIGWDGMDRIDLAQDGGQWKALVNTVMNLRVHKMLGSSWVPAQLAASQEGLSLMELVSRSYLLGNTEVWSVEPQFLWEDVYIGEAGLHTSTGVSEHIGGTTLDNQGFPIAAHSV
jgi:hypothetical protein